jgi:DNA-binding transcriptional regulator YdaS (Cro superfamily)
MLAGMRNTSPIQTAIRALGGDERFRAALGVGKRTLAYIKAGKRISAERAVKIETLTGVPRHELRPDLWAPPSKQEAA